MKKPNLHTNSSAAGRAQLADATPETIRGDVLQQALFLTTVARNALYGDCLTNMRAFGELMEWAEKWKKQCVQTSAGSTEHDAAMTMVLAKLARIVVGQHNRDNYVDAAAYLAMAHECECRMHESLPSTEA